jgi:hypothetical protein
MGPWVEHPRGVERGLLPFTRKSECVRHLPSTELGRIPNVWNLPGGTTVGLPQCAGLMVGLGDGTQKVPTIAKIRWRKLHARTRSRSSGNANFRSRPHLRNTTRERLRSVSEGCLPHTWQPCLTPAPHPRRGGRPGRRGSVASHRSRPRCHPGGRRCPPPGCELVTIGSPPTGFLGGGASLSERRGRCRGWPRPLELPNPAETRGWTPGRSPRLSRGGTVLRIAHQVARTTCSRCASGTIRRSASSPKTRMASCRTSIPRPFPTALAGPCLVGRGAMPGP